MKLSIITPEETLFEGEATAVQMPGLDGLFEVLDRHAPMIAALKKGVVTIKQSGNETKKTVNIPNGIVEVKNNVVTVLAG